MGASLMQPCRVYEEGLRVVKYFQRGGKVGSEELPAVTLLAEEAPAWLHNGGNPDAAMPRV